jgi:hypothetical protein
LPWFHRASAAIHIVALTVLLETTLTVPYTATYLPRQAFREGVGLGNSLSYVVQGSVVISLRLPIVHIQWSELVLATTLPSLGKKIWVT